MQPSLEVRWFFDGDLPEDVVSWYEDAVGLIDWQERTDRYVRPAAPDGLNVKWREGNIEIKRLTEDVGLQSWGEVAGALQRWRKWSFPLADELPLAATGRDWVSVAKHRATRSFTVRDGPLVLAKPGEQVPHRCQVEITALTCQHRAWWSLGLEAIGPDAEARDMLQRTVERVVAEDGAPELTVDRSMSYVRWLWGMDNP